MSDLPHLFGATLAIAAALASLCIWSRRRLAFRVAALVVTAMYLPIAYASLVDLLSRPKPLALEHDLARVTEATVISHVLREGEAIFVWLQVPELDEPRAYVLPWNEERARELHGAQAKAEAMNSQVRVRSPFKKRVDGAEPVFYAAAHAPPPPKPAATSTPVVFEGSAR